MRIFYQALWCWADDFGVGESNLYGWLGFAFPDDQQIYDPSLRDFRALCAEDLRRFCADCAQHYGVEFYIVRERHYYSIGNWDQHQKIERRNNRRKYPTNEDPEAIPDLQFYHETETARFCADKSAQNRRTNIAGTGEQGNRGTGEQGTGETSGYVERVTYESNARERKKIISSGELVEIEDADEIANESDPYVLGKSERGMKMSLPVKTSASRLVGIAVPHDKATNADRTLLRIHASELMAEGYSEDQVLRCLRKWLGKGHLGARAMKSCMTEVLREQQDDQLSAIDKKAMGYQAMKIPEDRQEELT